MPDDLTIIVGGGLTGLALADRLARRGRAVRLLEARERLGGRILSAAPASVPSAPRVDLGPAWFWPGQPRIATLAADLGLRVFKQHATGGALFETADGEVRRDLRLALNPDALRIDGGLGTLIDALAARLRRTTPNAQLELNRPVRAVMRAADGWRVDAADGAALAARTVVVTLPPRLAAETLRLPSTQILRAAHPTWMAGHAKLAALYPEPFWRAAGLSGDAISQRGPLAQIHDASPADAAAGALFGFVGLAAADRARLGADALKAAAIDQLARLFGREAAAPSAVLLQDWTAEPFTAIAADRAPSAGHPPYAPLPGLAATAADGLIFASTELAPEHGGLIEGALAAAEIAERQVEGRARARAAD